MTFTSWDSLTDVNQFDLCLTESHISLALSATARQ